MYPLVNRFLNYASIYSLYVNIRHNTTSNELNYLGGLSVDISDNGSNGNDFAMNITEDDKYGINANMFFYSHLNFPSN